MYNNFIIVPSNSLSKDNKIVTNKLSLVLDAVAILNFTQDALRVQAHNELFLALSFLKNIQI